MHTLRAPIEGFLNTGIHQWRPGDGPQTVSPYRPGPERTAQITNDLRDIVGLQILVRRWRIRSTDKRKPGLIALKRQEREATFQLTPGLENRRLLRIDEVEVQMALSVDGMNHTAFKIRPGVNRVHLIPGLSHGRGVKTDTSVRPDRRDHFPRCDDARVRVVHSNIQGVVDGALIIDSALQELCL